MIFDTHVHTAASPDSEMLPEEAICIAHNKGLGCIFTEHMDYNIQGEPYFCVDFKTYPKDYLKYKSDTVLIGMEINLLSECVEINRSQAANPNLDYIIGSVHFTDGFDIGYDTNRTADSFARYGEDFYRHHLIYALEVVEASDFFDAFGHIDYISRYSTLAEKNVLYGRFADEYDALLTALIKQDKVLELSTRRLSDKSACENLMTVYSRYRDLGGRYVTIGSDAHYAQAIGNNFDTALTMIDEIGLAPCYFKERRMIVCTTIYG